MFAESGYHSEGQSPPSQETDDESAPTLMTVESDDGSPSGLFYKPTSGTNDLNESFKRREKKWCGIKHSIMLFSQVCLITVFGMSLTKLVLFFRLPRRSGLHLFTTESFLHVFSNRFRIWVPFHFSIMEVKWS